METFFPEKEAGTFFFTGMEFLSHLMYAYLPCLFQVVQSLRLQSSKNYSELGSCPTLHSGSRPLLARTLLSEEANKPVEEMVQTATGKIMVARQGDPRRPAIITYHDLGLNYLTNFQVAINIKNTRNGLFSRKKLVPSKITFPVKILSLPAKTG